MGKHTYGSGRRDRESGRSVSNIPASTARELQKDIDKYHKTKAAGIQPGMSVSKSEKTSKANLNDNRVVKSETTINGEAQVFQEMEESKSARTAVFSLMLLSAFTKVFGFIREILLGRFFGIGDTAEAYKIAQTIPILILMVVGTGLATGFIPTYNRVMADKGKKQANRFMSNTLNTTVILGILFCIIVAVFPGFFVKLFASGFTGEKLELTMRFTRIAVWGVVFSFLSYIMQPYLQINERFWVPAVLGIPMNLVFYLSYPAGKYLNEMYLPLGIVLSVVVQVLWMAPFLRKEGFRWEPVADHKDEDLRHLIYLALPVLLGVAVNQINLIVDRTMASRVLDGGVASLDYANRMNGFVQGIFIYSVMTVVYPRISKLFIKKDYRGVEQLTTNALVTMSLVVIPCIVGLMVFSTEIISLLFKGGAFDDRAVMLTSGAMLFYAPGLIGFAFREILARVFYSMDDTKTPTFNAAIAVAINIVLNIVLSRFMGINGLALATSIASILGSFFLMLALKRQGRMKIHYRELLSKTFRIGLAALIMGILGKLAYLGLEAQLGLRLGGVIAIFLAVIVYAFVILFMKIPEVDEIVSVIRTKLGTRKLKK